MNILIFIRHGEADAHNPGLSEAGITQMQKAGHYLHELFGHQKPLLVSSTGPCAQHGAKIISEELGISYEIYDGLLAKVPHDFSPDILPSRYPAIVVTRGAYISLAAQHFAKMFDFENPITEVVKGASFALICNFDNRTFAKVDF